MDDVLFSRESDEWATPIDLFRTLHAYCQFTLDPCAMPENRLKLPTHYTKADNGIIQSWAGHVVFVNPPYSEIAIWLHKVVQENRPTVVLIPARTDTRYWHEFVTQAHSLLFIKGRLKFNESKNSAPFPSCLIGFHVSFTGLPVDGHKVFLKPSELY